MGSPQVRARVEVEDSVLLPFRRMQNADFETMNTLVNRKEHSEV